MMPMKLSIMTRVYWRCYRWPGRTFNFTLPQILNRIAQSGFQHVDLCEYPIEFWPLDMTEKDIKKLKEKLQSLNLKVSGITVPTFSPGLEILPEEEDRRIIVNRLKRAVELTSALNGETVMYGISPMPVYATEEEAYKWTVNLFHECSDLAEKLGVNLAIEFVNHRFPTSESIIEFLDAVNSENIGLCLEVGNVRARPPKETLMEHLRKCGERIKLVHVNDPANYEWLKSINVNMQKTMKALCDLGYEGPIVTESLHNSIPCSELDKEIAKTAKYLRGLIEETRSN